MKKLALYSLIAALATIGFVQGSMIIPRCEMIEKGRVVEYARELEQEACMDQVILFQYVSDPLDLLKMTKNANVQKISRDTFLVTINKNVIDEFTDQELKALVAHELGHVFWGHLNEQLTINTIDDYGDALNRRQAQADAFAIHFLGENSTRNVLELVGCTAELVFYRMREAKKIAANWPE